MSYPNLKSISWDVPEIEYRQYKAFSYSLLAKFAREGFEHLDTLFDRVSTPSLSFGSLVDTLITDKENFNNLYSIVDMPTISDTIKSLCEELYYNNPHIISLSHYSIEDLGRFLVEKEYYPNYKIDTKVKKFIEQGSIYYSMLSKASGKKLVDSFTYNQAEACCNALHSTPELAWVFKEDDPFDDTIQHFYQLKFKTKLINDIEYKCMADCLIVNHKDKTITPVDLKTSHTPEYKFYESFLKWRYDIQARLYWRIIQQNLAKSEEFKDYELLDYRFIVVNKDSLAPIVWTFKHTQDRGTLIIDGKTYLEDPETYAWELNTYLNERPKYPITIDNPGNVEIESFIDIKTPRYE